MINQINTRIRINKAPISVIIPTIGRWKYLSKCLLSLASQSILPNEVIVVDNSREYISKKLKVLLNNLSAEIPKINLKYVRENKQGISYARNAGIKASHNDIVAFTEDDCIVDIIWTKSILKRLSGNPKAIVQGKNLNGLNNNIFACLEHYSTESFFHSNFFENNNKNYCKYLNGKNFAFRKSALKNSLKFDTRFISIYEDIDFGLTARKKGIKIIYHKGMIVKHHGRSTLFAHLKREFNKGRNYYRLKKKRQFSPTGYMEIEEILIKLHEDKVRRIEKKLLREILAGKSYLFSSLFYLFLYIDPMVIQAGCEFEKFKSESVLTNIFLPRKIRVKKA